ncbi:hypothetical protein D9M73_177040 [compost metagenome]
MQQCHLQRQLLVAHDLPGLFHNGGHGAVGKLRVQRRQRHLGHALLSQPGQYRFQRWLAITHGHFHRAVGPVLAHRLLQASGQHDQGRAFIPPDGCIGMCRLLRALDQDQRYQQPANRPRQVNDVGVHQKLIEVAAYIGDFGGCRRTQVNQQQSMIGHATSYFRGDWTTHPGPIAHH